MTTAHLSRASYLRGGLAVLMAATLLGACTGSNGEQEQAAPPPPAVTVATPLKQRLIEYDEFTGRFEATAAVDVRARVSGYLQSVNFVDGAMVKEGDVLFEIDPRPYQAAVDRAKANLDSAQATLQLATSQLKRAQALADTPAISAASG